MATITKEIVEMVNKYATKFPQLNYKELSKLCGVSTSSVSCILNGMYNNLLEGDTEAKKIKSEIPYDTYKKLVCCELAIEEMLANSMRPNNLDEDALFLSYRKYSEIIKKYFPERFDEKVKAVQSEV
jgi:hypothetical protein